MLHFLPAVFSFILPHLLPRARLQRRIAKLLCHPHLDGHLQQELAAARFRHDLWTRARWSTRRIAASAGLGTMGLIVSFLLPGQWAVMGLAISGVVICAAAFRWDRARMHVALAALRRGYELERWDPLPLGMARRQLP